MVPRTPIVTQVMLSSLAAGVWVAVFPVQAECVSVPAAPGATAEAHGLAAASDAGPADSVLSGDTHGTCGYYGARDPCIPPGEDCWATECGGTRADFSESPLPADFFDPGSAPFAGLIELGGGGGAIDTVVQRLEPLCFTEPLPSTAQASLQLVQLDLVSCQPISVSGSGQWNVQVGLADPQPLGTVTVTKTEADGGTFSAQFYVQPVYIFTRVNPPYDTRVFDTAAQGMPPILMATVSSAPWSTNESFEDCSFDGFAPSVLYDCSGQPCCVVTCHSSGGTAPHDHCVVIGECGPCTTCACCLPDGSCVGGLTGPECGAQGGDWLGGGTTCLGDHNGDGIDDACGILCLHNGDFDYDGTPSLDDYAAFCSCLTGPGGGLAEPRCCQGDFDWDNDVDLVDYHFFKEWFVSPLLRDTYLDPAR